MKYFANRFAISSILFNLYIESSKTILYYIYNNLYIKDYIAILICKQNLKIIILK